MANIRTGRKSGFILRSGVMRRETVWGALLPLRTSIASNTAVLVASLNAATLALRPFTIVRTRGQIGIQSDQVVATEEFNASFAWAVVSEQASAVGVTAVPTPETDRDSDLFFVYETMNGEFTLITAAGFDALGEQSRSFDSKAMRKVNNDEDVVVVWETTGISSGVRVFDSGRFLLKLH